MLRQTLAFVTSLATLLIVAAIVFVACSRPPSVIGAIALASMLLIAYCLGANILRFSPRATIAGLLTGALLLNAVMIALDWAFAHPYAQSPTFGGFLRYLRLYGTRSSVVFLMAPFLLSLFAFFFSRGLWAAIARLRG
jgi:hypothetical protein